MLKRWKESEPVRLYLYGLLVPVLALLIAYGLIAAEDAPLWAALVTSALVPTGAELARRRTTPYTPTHRAGG